MTRLKVSIAHVALARPLLLIDVGNTRIKWVWIAGGVDAEPALPEESGGTPRQHVGACAHDRLAEPVEDWRDCHASGAASPGVWISAAADPVLRDALVARIARVFDGARACIAVSEDATVGLRNGYRDPTQLGTDRWTGAIGARYLWPDIVLLFVTAGTVTTLDIVTPDGLFVGGLIPSGLTLMMYTLSHNTAQLPKVDVGYLNAGDVVAPPWVDNTQDVTALGCAIAQVGAIVQTWQILQKQYPGPTRHVLSGGARVTLGPYLHMPFQMHDNLVPLDLQVLTRVRWEGAATLAQPQLAGLQFPIRHLIVVAAVFLYSEPPSESMSVRATTPRPALLILLLVDGVLLAANTGVLGPEVSKAWFESEREPDRMCRQICTEEIRILEPAPTAVSAVDVPKSASGSSSVGSAPTALGP